MTQEVMLVRGYVLRHDNDVVNYLSLIIIIFYATNYGFIRTVSLRLRHVFYMFVWTSEGCFQHPPTPSQFDKLKDCRRNTIKL